MFFINLIEGKSGLIKNMKWEMGKLPETGIPLGLAYQRMEFSLLKVIRKEQISYQPHNTVYINSIIIQGSIIVQWIFLLKVAIPSPILNLYSTFISVLNEYDLIANGYKE